MTTHGTFTNIHEKLRISSEKTTLVSSEAYHTSTCVSRKSDQMVVIDWKVRTALLLNHQDSYGSWNSFGPKA
eukprot:scaffold10626_cov112-Cylindrotheca_fusiformis.AAC.10